MTVERAAELLRSARHAIAVTGAGVSAESGIPTFRGVGAVSTKYDPVKVSSIETFVADPASYWQAARQRASAVLAARPNPGHVALARLEEIGRIVAVVTQNTDGLHQDAGSRRVIELHGSGRTVACMSCGRREARAEVQARLDVEMPPRCRHCGGSYLRPTVVLFGEAMPEAAVQEAYDLAELSDLVLVVGSSLVVYPAADVPLAALRAGARMIVLNAEPTPFDRLASVVLRGRSGELLPQIGALIDG